MTKREMRSWISRINDFWSKCGSRSKKAIREASPSSLTAFSVFRVSFFSSFLPFPVFLTLLLLPCFSCPVSLALFPCLVFLALFLLPCFSCPVSFALFLLPCFLALFFLPCFSCPVSLALFLSCAKIFAKKKGNLML